MVRFAVAVPCRSLGLNMRNICALARWHLDKSEKGRIIRAAEDIIPGTEIFTEPVLVLSPGRIKGVETLPDPFSSVQDDISGFYKAYTQLSTSNQHSVLDLFCPSSGQKMNEIKGMSEAWQVNTATRELLIKLAGVMSFCSFHDEDGRKLFALTCILSHSCRPNCSATFSKTHSTIRSILPVRKGEELTISYDPQHTYQPTHVRRSYLLKSKEFFCNCSRCNAMGDDTRQFQCYCKGCKGRHYMHQPTSTDTPYLLPCNICGISISVEQQHGLLHDESTFHERYLDVCNQLLSTIPGRVQDVYPLLNFPLLSECHSFSNDVAREKAMYCGELGDHKSAMKQARIALASNTSYITYPSLYVADTYFFLGTKLEVLATISSYTLAKECYQKAIQLHLLIRGRENRCIEYDTALVRVLRKLDSLVTSSTTTITSKTPVNEHDIGDDDCGFCNVRLNSVYIEGKYSSLQFVYCSEGCKQLHSTN